jgi:hypothetical protein
MEMMHMLILALNTIGLNKWTVLEVAGEKWIHCHVDTIFLLYILNRQTHSTQRGVTQIDDVPKI